VFAAADHASMDKVVAAKLIDASAVKVIAHTALVVAVRSGANVPDLAALATAGVNVVMADKTVPAGKYGLTLLDNLAKSYGADYKANVSANVVSYEANVKAVLQKVTNGDADAGIVYASDVIALGDKIQVLTIPTESAVIAEYVAAPLRNAAANAPDFVDFITSASAKPIWQQHGFTV
jgi:molybdate transport system substrate-binding protein